MAVDIQITLPKGTVQALAEFVSARTGGQKTNENTAIHFRYRDENSLAAMVTNGRVTMLLLLFRGSDQLTSFYFPEEEMGQTVSIVPTRGLLSGLKGEGKLLDLSISPMFCRARTNGEKGITEFSVPRMHGRQIALFDDPDSLIQYTIDDLMPAGQRTIDPAVIAKIARAADSLNLTGQLNIASINDRAGGLYYGFQVGSDNTVWWYMRQDTPVPAMLAGLPPDWVGESQGTLPLTVMLDEAAQIEDEASVQEAPALPYDTGEEENTEDEDAMPDELPDFSEQYGAEGHGDGSEAAEEAECAPDDSPAFVLRFSNNPPLSLTLQQIATHPKLTDMLTGIEGDNLQALLDEAKRCEFGSIVEAAEREIAGRA